MTPYYHSHFRRRFLRLAAETWLGTPWCMGSEARGTGVDCGRLCRALYAETGALPMGFEIPVRGFGSRHLDVLVGFLQSCGHFEHAEDIRPGDLLLFAKDRLHFAVALGNHLGNDEAECLVNCLSGRGVALAPIHDAAFFSQLKHVFRPYGQNSET